VIRTQRLRVPADLFKQDPVSFKRARVDASGTIRADGHNLDLYGAVLIRRDRICASPEGARWTCGHRAFMATRALVEGQPLSCSFRQAAGAPKAVCWVGDNDVTESLLRQGWAELAEDVTEESYVEAEASARRIKAGIWGTVRHSASRGASCRSGSAPQRCDVFEASPCHCIEGHLATDSWWWVADSNRALPLKSPGFPLIRTAYRHRLAKVLACPRDPRRGAKGGNCNGQSSG
jgi:hypothetical protein